MGKKNVISVPYGNALIRFTDSFVITNKLYISVPIQYKALVYIDDCSFFRVDPGSPFSFVKAYGSEHIGKRIRIAYIHWINIQSAPWELEKHRIELNDRREVEITANGSYSLDIINYPRLIACFPDKEIITVDDITKKVGDAVQNTVLQTVTDRLCKSFEDCDGMSKIICDSFSDDLMLSGMGVKIFSFSVLHISVSAPKIENEEVMV